jgi:hypothetical protein
MVAGFAVGILGVVLFVMAVVKTVLAPSHPIPGQFQLELAKGQWTIYEHTAREIGGANDETPTRAPIEFPRLTNESVRITAPSGQGVLPRGTSANESITQGTSVYTAMMVFDAPSSGQYSVQVTAGLPGDVIVTRGFGDTFVRAARWILLTLAGGGLFLLGGILLIVGIVRRRNAAGPPPPFTPAPATPLTDPTPPIV